MYSVSTGRILPVMIPGTCECAKSLPWSGLLYSTADLKIRKLFYTPHLIMWEFENSNMCFFFLALARKVQNIQSRKRIQYASADLKIKVITWEGMQVALKMLRKTFDWQSWKRWEVGSTSVRNWILSTMWIR